MIRAQFLPLPFAHAIQSQRPMAIAPITTATATPATSAAWIWLEEDWGYCERIALFKLPMVVSPMMISSALCAAPEYMSLTAIVTGCGAGPCGGVTGPWPPVG